MKSGGWIPVSKGCVKYLPKDRAYTELEAMCCIEIDYDAGKEVTVSGYADLWRWSRDKVYRFIKKIGIEIIYPQKTTKLRKQRGLITPVHTNGKRWRFVDSKPDIRQDIKPTLEDVKNQGVTKAKKHKTDIRQDTTIDPKNKKKNNT